MQYGLLLERGFGRLKHERAMLPLRVRRLPRVAMHVDLTILAQLADALTRAEITEQAAWSGIGGRADDK
jgi:hypothetical protein